MDLHVAARSPSTLSEPFVISRSADEEAEVVQVAIVHDGVVGYGESAPDPHYGDRARRASRSASAAAAALGDDPFAVEAILGRVAALPRQEMAARCAIDGALYDLVGKLCGQPLWRILGLDPETIPPTSYTICIDTVEGTADRARRAAGYHALKIKVGGPDDLERVRVVRGEAPDALIRVDANEAWSVEFTRDICPELVALNVELIEQPLPAARPDAYDELHRMQLPIPIVLDESCHTLPDVAAAWGPRRRRQHQADQVGRDPRGAADDPRRPGARPADHARLHERVAAWASRRPPSSRRWSTSSTSTATC